MFSCLRRNKSFLLQDIRIKCELTHHVICCVFAEESSPVIGLRSFVMPLRASNFDENELKPIVFIGNSIFLRKEWRHICNFPKVYLVDVRHVECNCVYLFYEP
jgi:hypothetical protein